MSDEINGLLKAASESPLAAAIRAALGVGPDEDVSIYSPPHKTRIDGRVVNAVPFSMEAFESLRSMPQEQLEDLGCQRFDESGLMLFPHEWYRWIPDGFVVRVIDGTEIAFDPGATSSDCRYGALAYGVIPEVPNE